VTGIGPSSWGDAAAAVYDDLGTVTTLELDRAVDVLAELARGGRVLELGLGSGRLAVPLAERGLEVHGIEASAAMVARLRASPGGDCVHVHVGDFADVAVEGRFSLVYCPGRTFFMLPTQEAQARCFRNVADHLDDDGLFLLEVWVPVPRAGDGFAIWELTPDRLELGFWREGAATQVLESIYLRITPDGVRLLPTRDRETSPHELDLMARLAGLTLRERWDAWSRRPFSGRTGEHVSVYAREAAA
jgi:SAM-dependent methyltransferase